MNKIKEIFNSKELLSFSRDNDEKNQIIKLISKNFPNYRQRIIEKADNILKNQFKIYEKNIRFEGEINWNYSFFGNKNWSNKHIKYIKKPQDLGIGDLRYNWRFNSHYFLYSLGLAYYFTRDEKYSKKLITLILDWIKKNPVNFNLSWKSSLITSYRLISWIFSLKLIRNSLALNNEIIYKIFRSMFQHAFYISINSEKYSYNHTIGEAFGLFLFSYIFQEITIVKKWYKKSCKLFKKQITRQTLIDGVNIERSTNYHRITLEFFTLFLILKPNLLNTTEKRLINQMYTFLAYSIKPDNTIPMVGDTDDEYIIPRDFYDNYKNHSFPNELISLGCVLFNRKDLRFLCKRFFPMPILIMGIDFYDRFKKIPSIEPRNKFHFFKNGGYFIARNSFKNDSNFLFFDMAKFQPPNGSHDHQDVSNIIYSYKGRPILIDAGTYRYNDSLKIRNYFRRYKSHNVLVVNGADKIYSLRRFGWNKLPRVKKEFILTDSKYLLKVQHDGFKNFLTSRKLTATKDLEMLEIYDSLKVQKKLEKKIKILLLFHFHERTKIKIENDEVIINNNLKMSFNENKNLYLKIHKSTYYYSPLYGVKILAPLITIGFFYQFKKNEKLEIITKIKPLV
ncbi:MAG: heparinase II/III family protein [Candidatus Hodarchaeota archaeon]